MKLKPIVETLYSFQSESPVEGDLYLPINVDPTTSLVSPGLAISAFPVSDTPLPKGENGVNLVEQIALVAKTAPEILQPFTASLLGRAFQADGCLVGVHRGQQAVAGNFQISCWQANGEAALHQVSDKAAHHPLIKILAQNSDPLVIADTLAFELSELFDDFQIAITARAILAVPIDLQGGDRCFLALVRCQPYYWAAPEIELVNQLAEQLAPAFVQSTHHPGFKSRQQKQYQNRARQALLEKLTLANRNALELNDFLGLALNGSLQALQVDQGMVLLFKFPDSSLKNWVASDYETSYEMPTLRAKATVVAEEKNILSDRTGYPITNSSTVVEDEIYASFQGISFQVSDCRFCQQAVVNSPKPLDISSINALLAEQIALGISTVASIAPIFSPQEMPAAVIVPLEGQRTVLGLLVLQHHQIRQWLPEDLMLLELVAAQISTAILQTQTLRQVQALVEERTAQLQHSLEVQGKLYETTRRQIDQLRQLNQMKDEFLSTVSHELLTPLTSMTLAIRMLRQAGLDWQRQAKYLDILEQQCVQETKLINDLLALQKLESQQLPIQIQKIEVTAFLRELVQTFSDRCQVRELTLSVDLPSQPFFLKSEQQSLQQVLAELISNAIKYAAYGSRIDLQVYQQQEDAVKQIVFVLKNTGTGIAPEDLPDIFNKFRRGQGITQRAIPGTGLGLALVQSLVLHLNGTITANSTPLPHNTMHEVCFTLAVPQFYEQVIG